MSMSPSGRTSGMPSELVRTPPLPTTDSFTPPCGVLIIILHTYYRHSRTTRRVVHSHSCAHHSSCQSFLAMIRDQGSFPMLRWKLWGGGASLSFQPVFARKELAGKPEQNILRTLMSAFPDDSIGLVRLHRGSRKPRVGFMLGEIALSRFGSAS